MKKPSVTWYAKRAPATVLTPKSSTLIWPAKMPTSKSSVSMLRRLDLAPVDVRLDDWRLAVVSGAREPIAAATRQCPDDERHG